MEWILVATNILLCAIVILIGGVLDFLKDWRKEWKASLNRQK